MNPPSVVGYLDYKTFLKDYYQFKKAQDEGFTFSKWAEAAGFSSRSFVRLVMVGRRPLTENSIPRFIHSMRLSHQEAEYFRTLVRFNTANELKMREEYLKKLRQFMGPKRKLIPPSYDYLSSHWGPRLHALLSIKSLVRTPKALAQMIKQPLSKINEILKTLELGGLATEQNGTWEGCDSTFEVPNEIGNLAIQSFHRNSLKMAVDAIDTDPRQRFFQSTFFALTEDQYKELCQNIDEYTNSLLEKFDSTNSKARKLYQININAIPVSGPLIHSQEKVECARSSNFDQVETGEINENH